MARSPAPWIVTCVALGLVSLGILVGGCSGSPKDGGAAGAAVPHRIPALSAASPTYDHFEGVAFSNACETDSECHVAGCSKEVCSADSDVTTVCAEYPDKPKTATCGCVRGLCIWFVMGTGNAAVAEAERAPTVR